MALDAPAPLRRLTGMDVPEFASDVWSRRPLLRRSSELPATGDRLLTLADVDELVSRRGLRTPFLRMARNGSVLPTGDFTRGGGAGAEIGDQAADDKVLRALAEGATLVLQGLHRTWPPVVEFVADLVAQLGHPVQANAYLTPAQNTGFDPHYDVHDVFVVQFEGRKRWRVHAPVLVDPLRDQPWDARRDEVAARAAEEPLLEVVLEPGDVLYLPRGYIHAATALGATSGHLTLGVQPLTRALVAEQVLATLGRSEELRASLPAGQDLADAEVLATEVSAVRKALHTLVDDLDDAAVAAALDRHLASRTRPAPISPWAQLEAADHLEGGHSVRLRPGLRVRLVREGDRIALHSPDATLSLPVACEEAARTVVAGDPLLVRDLPGLDEADALTFTRRLLREGIVVPAADA